MDSASPRQLIFEDMLKTRSEKRNSQPCKELRFDESNSREASQFWFHFVQKARFPKEWNAQSHKESIPKVSALKSLNTTLTEDSLLRLAGGYEMLPSDIPRNILSCS
ncbi:hypothetical protein HN011_010363 [Eciton burchellii]|nr:hypothetical protein HN011_010363 [Eciton burchellii]